VRSRGFDRVGFEQHRVLDAEEWLVAQQLPRLGGVLHRHVVGVRARSPLAGELEHLRPVRGQQASHRRLWWGIRACRRVHVVEVVAHRPQRLESLLRRTAEAQAQQVTVRVGIGQEHRRTLSPARVTGPDPGDAVDDSDPLAAGQQEPGVCHRLPPGGLRDPERLPATLVQLLNGIPHQTRRLPLEVERPDPEPPQPHSVNPAHACSRLRHRTHRHIEVSQKFDMSQPFPRLLP
jgi:hypothetical protein